MLARINEKNLLINKELKIKLKINHGSKNIKR